MHVQVYLILIHGFGIILGHPFTIINIMLVMLQGAMVGHYGHIRTSAIRHVV
jgi:hypothetical protein